MWQRWNQNTHVFEKSTDNGISWSPLPLSGTSITEGQIPAFALPPISRWTDVPYNPANFTADQGMTIITSASGVSTNKYTIIDKTMHWSLNMNAFTLGGTNGNLLVTIPAGCAAEVTGCIGTFICNNNLGGSGWRPSIVNATRGTGQLSLVQLPNFIWTAGDAGNYAYMNVTFPIF